MSSIVTHVRSPLHLNAYALMVATGSSAVLGFLFWAVATRMFSASTIGLNSGVVSALLLLAGISQLGLPTAVMRFLPASGAGSGPLVAKTYVACGLSALLFGGVFLSGIRYWEPQLGTLTSSPGTVLLFLLALVASSYFILQDNVLIGLRQSKWVPLENITANTLKVGLLVPAAVVIPHFAAAGAFVFAGALAVPVMGVLIFGRLLPRHAAMSQRSDALDIRMFSRFVASNYAASLLSLIAQTLMPLIVLAQAGPTQSGYFYVPWLIYFGLTTITGTASGSLLAEASLNPARATEYARLFMVQMLRLLAPASVALFFAAPLLLRIFGSTYAAQGTTTLRLLALATVPAIIIPTYISILRVRHQNVRMLIVIGTITALSVGLSAALVPSHGIQAVGWCLLVVQSLGAVALVIALGMRNWRAVSRPDR